MPFTLAHPAAVLPLVRRPFVASALVAGAVAPDLLYVGPIYRIATQYINGNFTLTLTHKLTSAFWLDPLLALLMLLVFNLALKRPLVALAPPALAARLPVTGRISLAVLLWTVLSAVVGALTHVIWDSFTHGDGYFVREYPDLLGGVNRILQYVSTIGGCLILAVWLYRWYRRTPAVVTQGDKLPAWIRYVVLGALALFALVGAVVELSRVEGGLAGETAVRVVLSGLVAGGLAALGCFVVLWHLGRLGRLSRLGRGARVS
ncbi:DUF4184 family protein [Kribbella sp.]|uniref:DUF4184 family protein n=1 Tax=Kribbella sp. TaxID=1871183 RepID=UPI002D683F8C|nr:DUF4184 family protein [Kribbella sp.]HZX07132.1 DUF4184 family protein [Kribbella sp.]